MSMKDTTKNAEHYLEFYEELGRKLPESAIVHGHRGLNSRYWVVWRELRPFARKGAKLLDVGCNDGVYTIPFCQHGGKALGIDISRTLVEKARDSVTGLGLECRFVQADIESLDVTQVPREVFDVALLSEVLEHVSNPERTMRSIHRLLGLDGRLILTAPTPLSEDLASLTGGFVYRTMRGRRLLEEHILDTTKDPVLQDCGVAAYLWRHDGYYPRALRRYVEETGFECERFYTIGLPHLLARKIVVAMLSERALQRLTGPAPMAASDSNGEGPRPVWRGLRSAYRAVSHVCELVQRRIPLVNLIGVTSVGVFRKREARWRYSTTNSSRSRATPKDVGEK